MTLAYSSCPMPKFWQPWPVFYSGETSSHQQNSTHWSACAWLHGSFFSKVKQIFWTKSWKTGIRGLLLLIDLLKFTTVESIKLNRLRIFLHRMFCIVLWAVVSLLGSPGSARSEPVLLTFVDLSFSVTGDLIAFDGETYQIDSYFGRLKLAAETVSCSGQRHR